MAEDLGERTEDATPRRLQQARRRGQVAKSQDLAAAIDLIGAAILLVVYAGFLAKAMGAFMRAALAAATPDNPLHTDAVLPLLKAAMAESAAMLWPVLLVTFVVAALAQACQVGLEISTESIALKPERLNPLTGLGRIFGPRNLFKTGINAVKLVVIGSVAVAILMADLPRLATIPLLDVLPAVKLVALVVLELIAWLLAILLVIGLVDFLYQRWQHKRDLRMTKQEVKDERKSSEGDPEVKSRRMKLALQIAMHRINQSVPKADVVVSNPTHFAVALRYDADEMRAPRVVAKGVDYLALRIRQTAIAARVPIVERPPLARALYYHTDVGQTIAPEHYEAVAEILAYVYRLDAARPQNARRAVPRPPRPSRAVRPTSTPPQPADAVALN